MDRLQRYRQATDKISSLGAVVDYMLTSKSGVVGDIVRATGLSHPTVAHALNIAEDINLIVKGQIATSSGGRRAQIYELNKDFIHILILVADDEEIVFQLRDFEGNVLSQSKSRYDKNDFIVDLTRQIAAIKDLDNLIEICAISLPCVVADGRISEWARLGLRKVNLAEQIEIKTGLRVCIENDMKLLSLSSNQADRPEEIKVSLYVDKNSIGVGVSIGGKVFRGANGYAGEIKYCPNMGGIGGDRAIKAAINAIAMYNPHVMTIYCKDSKATNYISAIAKKVPENILPEFVICNDYIGSQTQALWSMARSMV
ncbi:MAG: ROK family protein [Christensenellales bacterium]